jgi:hypothetical protein
MNKQTSLEDDTIINFEDKKKMTLSVSIKRRFSQTKVPTGGFVTENLNLQGVGRLFWSVKNGEGIQAIDFSKVNTNEVCYKTDLRTGYYHYSFELTCFLRIQVENSNIFSAANESCCCSRLREVFIAYQIADF